MLREVDLESTSRVSSGALRLYLSVAGASFLTTRSDQRSYRLPMTRRKAVEIRYFQALVLLPSYQE